MASRNLGSLTVDMLLKLGGFKQGMDAAARETDRFEKRLQQNFSRITSGFKSLAGAFGVGIGFEALRRSAAAAIEYGDEIQKASVKTGIAAEDFSELAYAAKQNDIEITSLGTALKKMQITLSEAGSGSKAANETLAALGLTIADLQRLSPDKQFETLADRIAALKDPADRTRAAVDLFGKAGSDLLPLFEQGAAGVRALREEAQRMGATLTGEQARALADADDAIKRLNQSWAGFARTLTASVAPALTHIFDTITGQNNAKLRDQIAILKDFEGRGGLFIASDTMGTGFRSQDQILERRIELEQQLEKIENRRTNTLPPGGRNRTPFAPGFEAPAEKPDKSTGVSKVVSETEKARERVTEFITKLQDQSATFGLTEAAALKYSVTLGDLSQDFDKLGAAAAPLREQAIALAESISDQQATAEINEQIAAMREQAATLGLTEQQAFAYSVTQGEMSKVIQATRTDAEEYTRVLLEQNNVLAQARAEIERQSEQKSIFEATRTDAERYTATLEHLQEVFKGSEDQVTYGRAVAQAAGEYVEGSTAAEEYRLTLERLEEQLASGALSQEAYSAAVSGAAETFATAGEEAATAFKDEAMRNTQGIVADFLTDPFSEGIDGLIQDFDEMFRRIAAQAVATRIAEKLFEGFDDVIAQAMDLLKNFFAQGSSGGLAGLFGGSSGSLSGFESMTAMNSLPIDDVGEAAATTAAGTATAAAITTAGAASATAITTAGTATATALTTSSTAGATSITAALSAAFASGSAALTAAGATLAGAITAAGTAAAAAIAAAGAASGASSAISGLGDIAITAVRMAGGGIVGRDWASAPFKFAGGGAIDAMQGGVIHGPGTGTSDSIPAITTAGRPLLLSAGEHITRAAVVREPGAATFLATFNRYGMEALENLRGFAEGGFLGDGLAFAGGGLIPAGHFGVISGDRMRAANAGTNPRAQGGEPVNVTQTFMIAAPQGSVSRSTQQQVGAAAFRGAARAAGRSA